MKYATNPFVLLGLVVLAVLFGRIIPAWTLSLATVAASKALVALGIVVLARTGNVSFGQGLFYAGGGYGVALIAHNWGLTDAVAQVMIGAVFGGLLGLIIGPLIARYTGIFFGMLTLALSMVLYGAGSRPRSWADGFNVGRPPCSAQSSMIPGKRTSCSTRCPWLRPASPASSRPPCSARSSA
jgi:branched-chain amino acid transport system permease protein